MRSRGSFRPLVPLPRVLALGAAGVVASRNVLAATFVWFLALAAVYAADAGPPLAAMAVTAVVLLPVAAWATAALLAAGSEDLRALLVAANGRMRMLLADALLSLLVVAGAAVLGVGAAVLFDPHPAFLGQLLLGALLHLLCGASGAALALLLHALHTSRGTQTLVVVAASLASARVPQLPPAGAVLAVWSTGGAPRPALAAWALLGPVVLVAVLLAGTAAARRRG